MNKSGKQKNIGRKTAVLITVCLLIGLVTLGASFWYGVVHPELLFDSDGTNEGFIKLMLSEQKALDRIVTIDEDALAYSRRLALLEENADYDYMSGKTNILMLGIDENQEREGQGFFRTDTMIILNIDFENDKAKMLSIPRDSLVWITGYGGKARVNRAFGEGGGYNGKGFKNAIATVSKMMGGLEIDSYVCVDMEVLKSIVDAIGGVDYDVDHVINTSDAYLEVGQQHLWGSQVLAYVRQRKGQSDIIRIDRQQRMLEAIFTQMKANKKLVLIPQLYTAVKDDMYTDLSIAQISALARWAMGFDIENLERDTVPGQGIWIGGSSYWAVNQYRLEDIIEDMFGLSVRLDKSNDVKAVKAAADRFNQWQATALEQRNTTGAYIIANHKYCRGGEYGNFLNMATNLEALANTVSLTDPGGAADNIKMAVSEFTSFCTSLEATIRERQSGGGTGGDGGGTTSPTDPPSGTTGPAPTTAPTSPPDPEPEPETPDDTTEAPPAATPAAS